MKSLLLSIALLAACGKPNDVVARQAEVVALVRYYQPRIDALDRRLQAIFKRGQTIPANIPGVVEVGKRATEAKDAIKELQNNLVPGPDQKSELEKRAGELAKQNKLDELDKVIDEASENSEHLVTVANDDLYIVETWIAQYDRAGAPAPAPEKETAAPKPDEPPPMPKGAPNVPAANAPQAPTPANAPKPPTSNEPSPTPTKK